MHLFIGSIFINFKVMRKGNLFIESVNFNGKQSPLSEVHSPSKPLTWKATL